LKQVLVTRDIKRAIRNNTSHQNTKVSLNLKSSTTNHTKIPNKSVMQLKPSFNKLPFVSSSP
jgi:hypothetical protein